MEDFELFGEQSRAIYDRFAESASKHDLVGMRKEINNLSAHSLEWFRRTGKMTANFNFFTEHPWARTPGLTEQLRQLLDEEEAASAAADAAAAAEEPRSGPVEPEPEEEEPSLMDLEDKEVESADDDGPNPILIKCQIIDLVSDDEASLDV